MRTQRIVVAMLFVTFVLVGDGVASAQSPVRVMPLGDSITRGVNDTLPAGGYPGYRAPLWNQLVLDGFNIDFVGSLADGPFSIDRNHEGHGGFRIDQILANINSYLTAAGPDVILLHIGTNDLLQDRSVDQTTQRLAELLDRIHQLRPGAHLIVASIITVRTPNISDADPQHFAEYAANVAGLVGDRAAQGRRISHLDMANLVGLMQSEWDSVGIHPNDVGYGKMAAVWYPDVATLLDGDAPPTVGMTYPFDGSSVSGQVTLSAAAFDDFGVTGVEFAVDGVPIVNDMIAPYQTVWDSDSVTDGPHTLRVTARDALGQTRIQIIRFTTVNPLSDTALVAAFGFEESEGSVAFDGSGRGNHASLIGVSRTAQGHAGNGVSFNGTSGRVEVKAPAADFRFTDAFTISVWVHPTTLATGWHMIAARQLGAGGADAWFLGHNGTTLNFFAGALVTTSLTAGQWTHIGAVKNGSTVAVYKNGVLAASTTTATTPLATDANEVGIGAGNNGNPLWGEYFQGRLDDLRFYRAARTAQQIQSDRDTPVGMVPDTLPPVIANVVAAAAAGTATITWTTDEASTSQVEYGPTTSYGSTSVLDPALMTSHTVVLAGLALNAQYHYRVRSRDGGLNEATSGDFTFTTTAGPATLVAAYGFEEASGTTAVDSAGDDHPGTLTGGVVRAAGRFGRGVVLDGVDDRVTVAPAAALNMGTDAFTAGVWMKTVGSTLQRVVGKRAVCTGGTPFWNLHLLQGSGVVAAEVRGAAGEYLGLVGTRVVNDGLWHYLTLVRNGVMVQVYVDGVLDVSGTTAAPADVSNTASLEIGALCGTGQFNGQLDEARVYRGALSPSEIQAAMNSGVVVTSSLVAAYNFDAGSGPTAADQSGRGNTLTLVNATWAAGHSTGAVQFNGTSSRAELPSPAIDLAFTDAFTISVWVHPTTLATGWHMIAARQVGASGGDAWFLGHNGTTLHFFAGALVATPLPAGQWTHIGAVKNGSTVAVYKNGVLAASTTTATTPLATDANEVGIGAGNNGNPVWGEYFQGRLDDLRFYREARTAQQIQSDRDTPVGLVPDTLPPVIANVVAAAAAGTATITWTTDEASTSQVEYGPTTSYGSTSVLDPALMTSHTVVLEGLALNAPYHYRVRSRDGGLNEATSGDFTFTTTAGPATLVAAYGFEEASGTTAVDSAGDDHPGTLTGGVVRAAGRFGRGLVLDGVDDRVTVAPAAALNMGTDAFTVGVWMKTVGSTLQRVIGKRAVCTGGTAFWNLHLFQGSGVIAAEVRGAAGEYLGLVGTRPVNDGLWHYLTLVRNGVMIQVYVDGVLDVSGTTAAPADVSNTAPLEIGALCGTDPFNGQLDEARVYRGALSPSEIQAAMNSGVVVTSSLVAAYNFDAGSGPTAADQSGRGNTLTLVNATWAAGHSTGAVQFNGTSSRAELPSPAIDLAFTDAFTISVWVHPTTLATGWHMIAARQLGAGGADAWFLGHNGTTLNFFAGALVTTPLTAGQWTHIGAVKNGSTVAVYKNGVLAASTTTATTPLATDANEVGIGAGNNGNPLWGEYFQGRLDDLRFYGGAQTVEQIQTDRDTPVM